MKIVGEKVSEFAEDYHVYAQPNSQFVAGPHNAHFFDFQQITYEVKFSYVLINEIDELIDRGERINSVTYDLSDFSGIDDLTKLSNFSERSEDPN